MTTKSDEYIELHGEQQKHYFEHSFTGDMSPKATPYIKRQVDELIAFAGLTRDQLILDLGCGSGRYTLEMVERGYRLEGLDITPGLLDKFREFNAGRFDIPLYCENALKPPAELVGRYDAVIGYFTMHHLPDLAVSFAACRDLVKPGGVIAFLEPNPWCPLYYVQIALTPGMTWAGDRGMKDMRPGPVFAAMGEAGLVDSRWDRVGFLPPFAVNRPWGRSLERGLEAVPFLKPMRAFTMMRATRPAA
jgi:SAM-dependent methyltransferase